MSLAGDKAGAGGSLYRRGLVPAWWGEMHHLMVTYEHTDRQLSKQSTSKWWSLMADGCTLKLQTKCFKWCLALKYRWLFWSCVSNVKWLRHKWWKTRFLLLSFYGKFLSNGVSEARNVKVHPGLGPCLLLWICKWTVNYEWTGGFHRIQPLFRLGNEY